MLIGLPIRHDAAIDMQAHIATILKNFASKAAFVVLGFPIAMKIMPMGW